MNFNPKRIQMGSATLVSSFVLVAGLLFWKWNEESPELSFDLNLFYWGLFGSIINIMGITSLQVAISMGPAGPISAFVSMSNVLLTILEAIYYQKRLELSETFGFFIGFSGVLFLVIPELFEKIFELIKVCFSCCFRKNPKAPREITVSPHFSILSPN